LCERSISSFPSKEGLSPQPLGVGQTFPPPQKFPIKYWEAADGIAFNNPSSRPQALPKELFSRTPGEKDQILNLTDKDLKEEEKVLREITSLWSIYRWSFSSLEALSEVESLDEIKDHLQTITNQQKMMIPFMEERIMRQLTNTILRRRDAFLSTKDAQKLQESTITKLRSSPLVGPELLVVPRDLMSEEQEFKSSRTFLSKMFFGAKGWVPQQGFTRQAPRPQRPSGQRASAAAGSAAQLASMAPAADFQQWPQTSKGFKPRKSNKGRGNKSGFSTLDFKSGPSARGRKPFRGRGRRQ